MKLAKIGVRPSQLRTLTEYVRQAPVGRGGPTISYYLLMSGIELGYITEGMLDKAAELFRSATGQLPDLDDILWFTATNPDGSPLLRANNATIKDLVRRA